MVATAIMAISAAVGIGMNLYSMNQQENAQNDAAENQNAQYRLQHDTSKKAAAVNKRIERLKQRQATLDYQRNRREIIRNTIKARAEATARASNAGALTSSSYEGARANIVRESGLQQLALYENKRIGDKISEQNKKLYGIQARAGVLGTNLNIQGSNIQSRMYDAQAIGSLGSMLFNNSRQLGEIGQTLIQGQGSQNNPQAINPWDPQGWADNTTIGA